MAQNSRYFRRRKIRDNISGYSFLSPSIIILLFIFGYQVIRLFWFSLSRWDGYIIADEFNNFSYFQTIFTKGFIFAPILRSMLIAAIVIPIVIILTTFIAHNIYRRFFGWKFYKWVIFLSSIIPVVVASVIWTYLLNLDGPLNILFRIFHLNFLVVDWFGNPRFAILALCWIVIWRELGFSTIIFTAHLASADPSVYEAALIDGANEYHLMRYITYPNLNKIIKLYIVTMTIFVLNNLFSVVLVSTNGGPGYATTVLEYYIYFLTFRMGKIGMGSAVAVILFIITFILILIYIKSSSREKGKGIF